MVRKGYIYTACLILLTGCGISPNTAQTQKIGIIDAVNKANIECQNHNATFSEYELCRKEHAMSAYVGTAYETEMQSYYEEAMALAKSADEKEIISKDYQALRQVATNTLIERINLKDADIAEGAQRRQTMGQALGQGMQNYGKAIASTPKPVTCNTYGYGSSATTTCY